MTKTHGAQPLVFNNTDDLKHPIDQLAEDLRDGTLEYVLKGGVPGDEIYNSLKAKALAVK